jgi:predicted DNA-binding protein
MVNERQDVVDKRLAETLDLFRPTARQEAAAAEVEEKVKRGKTPHARRWEKDNPTFAYRIRPEDDERITTWAARLGATKDEVARGLMAAALEAMDEGWLWLVFDRTTAVKEVAARTPGGKATTRRIAVKQVDVQWAWGDRGEFRR